MKEVLDDGYVRKTVDMAAAEQVSTTLLDFIRMALESGDAYHVNVSADDLNCVYHPEILATPGMFVQIDEDVVQFYYERAVYVNKGGSILEQ